MADYIDAIKILRVQNTGQGAEPRNAQQANLREANSNISMYHTYMYTELDTAKETIAEAIKKGNYTDNECWINTLKYFYNETLISNKKKDPMTRERILQLINKKEKHFKKHGASIDDMIPLFVKYRIQVRIIDQLGRIIYRYDPEVRNPHIKPLFAMVKNSHIYTLNNNINRLAQKTDSDGTVYVKARSDYYISGAEKPSKCRMFSTIDDIFDMVKEIVQSRTEETKNDKDYLELVHQENDLNKIFCDFKSVGYEPSIVQKAGAISYLKGDFNNVYFCIKTQMLVDDQINSDVPVDRELVYNNMAEAFFRFKKSLFNPNHRSDYSSVDTEVLTKFRTVVPLGELFKNLDNMDETKQEIDICKAFTKAFSSISHIPVFDHFDNWKIFNPKSKIRDLNLYIVNGKLDTPNMFFNKQTTLIYGMFLKEFMPLIESGKLKITHYKQPHFIHKVDYKSIIDELWGQLISDDSDEDKSIKKLIANVSFGLLEKGTNRSQRSFVFDDVSEAVRLQADVGGKLNMISRQTAKWVEDYDENGVWCRDREVVSNDESLYYVLNVSDTSELRNGFRYIKELLLQHHNYKMQHDYQKLVDNDIKVLSVFYLMLLLFNAVASINGSSKKNIQEVLDFDGIGG